LLVREGVRLPRTQFGGHQEGDRRPGTESVALAAGMARALELWHSEQDAYGARLKALRDRLETGLLEKCAPAIVNGDQAPRLPNTLNIAFPGCDGEALLVALDLAGICASLGSACASGSAEPSPILIAMGLPAGIYRSSIRFSVGWTNTEEEIDAAIERVANIVQQIRAK
jgi:cysteine desulfurase